MNRGQYDQRLHRRAILSDATQEGNSTKGCVNRRAILSDAAQEGNSSKGCTGGQEFQNLH